MHSPTRLRMAALLLVLLAPVACSKAGTSTGPLPSTLRIGIPITPTQLNPILTQNQIEASIDGLMFSKLVTITNHGRDIPDLAAVVPTLKNGGISKNGLTITYHLRHGVTWQDGRPFTSKDVKFTWQAIMNPNNNVVSREGYDVVKSVSTPNKYTVVFHMKKIYPPAIDTLFAESDSPMGILPAHLLAKYPNLNNIPFNSAPIGTGPYTFVRWIRGDRIVLAANTHYFLGAPKIKRVTLKIIPDGNTMESEIRAHDINLSYEISATMYHNLESDPAVKLYLAKAPSWTAVMFNTKRPPLNDVAVRRAIAFAINKQRIVNDNTYGTATVAIADQTPFSWAYDPALKPIPYNVAHADALLRGAGWLRGRGGIRMKNGKPLALQLVYGQGNQLALDLVVEVQSMLKKVGIPVQLKSYNYAILYESAQAGGILNGEKFDMALYAWVAGTDPDDSSMWTCSMVPPAGNNVSQYCSKAMDAAQRLALSTFNRSVRKRAYVRIQQLLLRDAPAAFLYDTPIRYALSPQLHNFKPNGISEGWNAQDWYFSNSP